MWRIVRKMVVLVVWRKKIRRCNRAVRCNRSYVRSVLLLSVVGRLTYSVLRRFRFICNRVVRRNRIRRLLRLTLLGIRSLTVSMYVRFGCKRWWLIHRRRIRLIRRMLFSRKFRVMCRVRVFGLMRVLRCNRLMFRGRTWIRIRSCVCLSFRLG